MRKIFYALAFCLTAFGCSTPAAPEFDPEPSYLTEVAKSWSLFGSGNYALSATSFRNALDIDLQRIWPEAYIGLGWSLAMQDSLTRAISNFNTALQKTPRSARDSVYTFAGLGLAYRNITPPNFGLVRDNVLLALGIDPLFVFEYKSTINADDLEAVLAEAYFNLGDYVLAAAIADPGASLDPAASDYQFKLLTRIDQLITLSREGE